MSRSWNHIDDQQCGHVQLKRMTLLIEAKHNSEYCECENQLLSIEDPMKNQI